MARRLPPVLIVLLLVTPFWLLPGRAPADRKDASAAAGVEAPRGALRRPVAVALVDKGETLLVANRDSGSISVFDARSHKVVGETKVARRLSDFTLDRKRDQILVADETAGEVIILDYRERTLREISRVKVGVSPVGVRVADDGTVAVACLWPRQLVLFDVAAKTPRPAPLDLEFAPRRLFVIPGAARLLVADSFAAQLAVVDLRHSKLEKVGSLTTAHNIRGLALDRYGKDLLVTHQTLHASGHPTAGDIRSGNLIANELRKIPLSVVLDPRTDLLTDNRLHPLGDIDFGAGDPADVAETEDGKTLVALAGIDELLLGEPDKATWTRLKVGKRPTALAVDPVRRRAYVANTFGDSISVVDLQAPRVVAEIPLGPTPAELRPEERGEMLFYNARLSLDGWYSCHSCHTDGHTSGRLNDNLSDGSFGTPKRVLSLLGVRDSAPFAWNGKMDNLPAQVHSSLISTMQGPKPAPERVRDLVAYIQTLAPPPAVARARERFEAAAFERGRKVFNDHKCGTCHTAPTYTSPKTYDVGLRDEAGLTHFNPPSLRGLGQAGPYFHDGRAATLTDVFTRHRHRLSADLSERDLADLLHFLQGL